MTRNLDSDLITHIEQGQTVPVLLVKAEFDSGDLRLWTGYGDIEYNSETYTGAGNLIGFAPVRESSEIRANGAGITLSGVPSELVSIALTEKYQGRVCTIYLGAMDSDGLLIEPYQLFSGRMDVMTLTDSRDTANISMSIENILVDLEKPNSLNYTPESQKIEFPNDTGFKWVTSLQNKTIIWGKD